MKFDAILLARQFQSQNAILESMFNFIKCIIPLPLKLFRNKESNIPHPPLRSNQKVAWMGGGISAWSVTVPAIAIIKVENTPPTIHNALL